jgi:CubicO group peptidase (beta-lactamase class C family)
MMVVTLKLGEQPCFFSRGEIELGSGIAPDANTIFELASITKVFTTAILGLRAWQGLDVWSPVETHLPSGYKLGPKEKNVTFQQLATFTGGFWWDDPHDFDKGTSYTQKDFEEAVGDLIEPQHENPIQGQEHAHLPTYNFYSNGSTGFLGQILMNMDSSKGPCLILGGCPSYPFDANGFSNWISANLTGPLNMKNTAVEPGGQRATGYSYTLLPGDVYIYEPQPAFLWQPWGAAGALRSNATDMLNFLKANICAHHFNDPNCTGLPQNILDALALAHLPNVYSPAGTLPDPTIYVGKGSSVEQAWAWQHRPAPVPNPNNLTGITSKDGGHPGFSTWIGFSPQKAYGLVILMNTGGGGLIHLGEAIIDNTQ